MKRIEKSEQVVRTYFVCETCEAHYSTDWQAECCEKEHVQDACKHPGEKYFISIGNYYEGVNLTKKCIICDKIIDDVKFQTSKNQEFLSTLYQLFKEYN